MSGDWRGTLWTLLVTFCIVIIKCTETFWSPCTKALSSISGKDADWGFSNESFSITVLGNAHNSRNYTLTLTISAILRDWGSVTILRNHRSSTVNGVWETMFHRTAWLVVCKKCTAGTRHTQVDSLLSSRDCWCMKSGALGAITWKCVNNRYPLIQRRTWSSPLDAKHEDTSWL
jgi:hypothetical protein